MKRQIVLLCLALLMDGRAANATDSWTLVWSDGFDRGTKPDTAVWQVTEGNGCPKNCGFGNNERQTYTDHTKNLRIRDGKLIIEARRVRGDSFTSAKLTTQKIPGWQYGKIEMRAKLPAGVGTWPAFWLMPDKMTFGPWPKSGEIDIMEQVGYAEGHVHGTVHTEAYNHRIGTQKGAETLVSDATTAFHTYGIEWNAASIRWYVDGREYFRFDKEAGATSKEWPYDRPFHIILNLAVGGDWGGKEGIDLKAFPATYEIDWVKVWQKAP